MLVGVEVAADDAGKAAFQAAQSLGAGHAFGFLLAVVSLPEPIETDLGDRDPMHRRVELPVAGAGQPGPAGGTTRPDRDRRDPGVASERGVGLEPTRSCRLADDPGRGQRPAADIASRVGGTWAVRCSIRFANVFMV